MRKRRGGIRKTTFYYETKRLSLKWRLKRHTFWRIYNAIKIHRYWLIQLSNVNLTNLYLFEEKHTRKQKSMEINVVTVATDVEITETNTQVRYKLYIFKTSKLP